MKDAKVIQLGERVPRLKKQRGKKANRRLALYMSILFLLVLFMIYFQSPLSNIANISIKGSHYMGKKEILKVSGITYDMSYFRVDAEEAEHRLLSRKEIKKATVQKVLWNQVRITVQEHKTIGYSKKDGKLYPMLSNGTSLPALKADTLPVPAPVLSGMNEEALKELAGELNRMPAGIFRAISEIKLEPKSSDALRIRMYMGEGYEVIATIRDLANRMSPYPLIIQNIKPGEKVLIHLEVGAYIERLDTEESQNES